jgi:translation elongation factor 1 epsilon-1
MSLSLDTSHEAEFLRFAARFCGVNTASAASGPIRLRLGKTCEIHQLNAIAKYFARAIDREAELCGATSLEKAHISMWLDFASGISHCPPSASATHWKVLETNLQTKTYFAGNRVTLADAALFWVLYPGIKKLSPKEKEQWTNLLRWFDQIQHTVGVRGFKNLDLIEMNHQQIAFTV